MKQLTYSAAMLLLALAAGSAHAQIGADATDAPPLPSELQVDPAPDVSAAPAQTFAEETSPADFGITTTAGADGHLTVSEIADGSPAAIAGIRAGDHIVSLDGQFITTVGGLHEYLAAHPATPITAVVLRDGTQQTIVINQAAPAVIEHTAARVADRPALGVRFLQGNDVVLTETLSGSPAEIAGLHAGDRIISVNGNVIQSSDHFIALIAATEPDQVVNLTLVRGGDRESVVLTPADWNSVFDSARAHVTLKPADPAVATATYAPAYYSPYYVASVSPVGVPGTAFVRYYHPWSYAYVGYPYYGYPYYAFSYYYPNWYYHAWPWGAGYYGGPYTYVPAVVPAAVPADRDEDSARLDERGAERQLGQVTVTE